MSDDLERFVKIGTESILENVKNLSQVKPGKSPFLEDVPDLWGDESVKQWNWRFIQYRNQKRALEDMLDSYVTDEKLQDFKSALVNSGILTKRPGVAGFRKKEYVKGNLYFDLWVPDYFAESNWKRIANHAWKHTVRPEIQHMALAIRTLDSYMDSIQSELLFPITLTFDSAEPRPYRRIFFVCRHESGDQVIASYDFKCVSYRQRGLKPDGFSTKVYVSNASLDLDPSVMGKLVGEMLGPRMNGILQSQRSVGGVVMLDYVEKILLDTFDEVKFKEYCGNWQILVPSYFADSSRFPALE